MPASDGFVTVASGSKNIATEHVNVNGTDVEIQYVAQFAGELPHGCLKYHVVSASGTNAANIKASPGQVYGWRAYNNAGYPVFVKFHDVAVTPTPGAGVVGTVGLEAGLPDKDFNGIGEAFLTGIGISIVKGIADSDTTGVLNNDCVLDIFFK